MSDVSRNNLWLTGVVQILLVAVACIASYHVTRRTDIIPDALLRLPAVHVSMADMWYVVRIFSVAFLVQVVVTTLCYRSGAFASPRRFASEYLFYLLAYTTASLYAFLATTINYDPQLIAGIGLFSTGFYLLAFGTARAWRDPGTLPVALWQGMGALLRRLASVSGVLVLLYFLLPLALGIAFTKDRDIANRITQVRIWFNPVAGSDWGFRNFFPDTVFEQPLAVVQAPGDSGAVYVLERVGRVYRVPLTGGPPELALDIGDQLGEVEVENGALGLAFHPRFDDRSGDYRHAYLYYTDTRPDSGQINRLVRFDFRSDDPAQRKASAEPLLVLEREGSGFHNGGSVLFGPDGYLYVALGEGVRTPDGNTSAQMLRAGIIRIDVDGSSAKGLPIEPFGFGALAGYRVPADNPFVDNPAIRNEYWVLGLRNPFRISFDPETGELWAGDVGSTVWEEVNRLERGRHYGYPEIEGRTATGREGWESLGLPMQPPVYTYMHDAYDRAVIGGVVYRGNRYPSLRGQYIFADNYSAKLFSMPADVERVDEVTLLARANQYAQRGVSSVTQLPSGEILITTLGPASEPGGEVLLLVEAAEADPVEAAGNSDSDSETPAEYDQRASAKLFAVNCTRCHGATGAGDGPDAPLLGIEIPDLTSPLYHADRSADEIQAVIERGGAELGMSPLMPPWGGFLTEREIDHLVIYIQSLPGQHHHH